MEATIWLGTEFDTICLLVIKVLACEELVTAANPVVMDDKLILESLSAAWRNAFMSESMHLSSVSPGADVVAALNCPVKGSVPLGSVIPDVASADLTMVVELAILDAVNLPAKAALKVLKAVVGSLCNALLTIS